MANKPSTVARPRKAAAKKAAPAKKTAARKATTPTQESSVKSLQKKLDALYKEIIDTVEDYSNDGVLCDTERLNIEERFSRLGVQFPKSVGRLSMTWNIEVCKEGAEYAPSYGGKEPSREEDDKIDDVAKVFQSLKLPHGYEVVDVDVCESYFD